MGKYYQRPIIAVIVLIGLALWLPKIWTKDTGLVAQLTAQEFYEALGGAVALLAALQWFLTTLIESRMKYEYDLKLEDYKRELQIRDQAAKVAEFLAFAGSTNADPMKFNEQAWALSLWLPTDIYIEIAKLLAGDKSGKPVKEILIDVRKLLLGDKAGSLNADKILHTNKPY